MLLRTRSLLMGWTTVLYLLLLVLLTVEGSTGTANQSLRQNETSSTTTLQHRTLQRVSVGSIISLVLFNTEKNVPIQVLLPNVVVNLQSAAVAASTLTIQAMVRRASTTEIGIDYVQFGLDQNNNNARKEYNAPYALCGDQRNLFLPCRTLTVGSHTVSATPYFAGKAGTTLNVTFRIVDTPPSTKSCKIPRLLDNTWTNFSPNYPLKIKEMQGATIGSDIVVISGFINKFANATNRTYARDVGATKDDAVWRRMDDLPVEQGITHAAVTVVGQKIYFCGGFYGGNPGVHIPDCYVYDHNQRPGFGRQWSRISSLPNGGTGGGGIVYSSAMNALYYATGGTRDKVNPTRDIFDVNTFYKYELHNPRGGWTSIGVCPHKANHISAVTAFDRIGNEHHFFLGGQVGKDECQQNLDKVYEWNPLTMKWTRHTNIPFPRGHAPSSTLPISCGFVMAGGSVNSPTGCFYQTSDISYYDIGTRVWRSIGNLSNTDNSPVCSIGKDGYFYRVSGNVNRRRIRVDP